MKQLIHVIFLVASEISDAEKRQDIITQLLDAEKQINVRDEKLRHALLLVAEALQQTNGTNDTAHLVDVIENALAAN